MQYIVIQQCLFSHPLIKKDYLPTLDKNAYKCGFLEHIRRTIETHKQTEQSVYVFFCLPKTFLKVFLSNMQQTDLLCWDLVQRERKEQSSLPFITRKGMRKMKPSSFQTTIENQFDYICKRAIEDERKNYFKHLSRISKHEVSFSNTDDYLVNQFSTIDNYSSDLQIFTWNDFNFGVESDLLCGALRKLTDKKRNIVLLYYFMDMSDTEIAELLKLNRSTVYRHRTSGLAFIKKFMEEHTE